MPSPRVSIIIPTYNRTIYLPETIGSVLAQTRPVAEILIIDDGSSPPFKEQLKAIAATSGLISLIHLSSNQGVSHARNQGMDRATGDYLLFLDDDDTLHRQMIETGLAILEAEETVDGVFCLSTLRHEPHLGPVRRPISLLFDHERLKTLPLTAGTAEALTVEGLKRDPFHSLLRSNIAIHSCLLRKKAVGRVRFPEDLAFGEDKYFWLQLARQGCRFKLHRGVHAVIRRHDLNYSGGTYRVKAAMQLKYYDKLLEDGLLVQRRSLFLVYLKLFHIRRILRKKQDPKQIAIILQTPQWIALEFLAYCRRRLALKWHFMRCYASRQALHM